MITLHHLNNSRSQRIIWLLEELELPYEIKQYERSKETMLAPESLKKIHPLGKSPVITDDKHVVAESGAIIEYLISRYGKGKLKPSEESEDWVRYIYWLHYAEGTLMPPLLVSLIFQQIEKAPLPFFVKPIAKKMVETVRQKFIRPQVKLNLDFIESELKKSLWLAGNELTAADIQMSFPLEAASSRGGDQRPTIKKYLEQIHARPAYQEAIRKGGPFSIPS